MREQPEKLKGFIKANLAAQMKRVHLHISPVGVGKPFQSLAKFQKNVTHSIPLVGEFSSKAVCDPIHTGVL